MIIDAHIHLPVITEGRTYEQAKALCLQDLKTDGVDFAIVIPDNAPDSEIGDVPTCLRLLKETPELYLMGTIDVQNQGQAWIHVLETLILRKQIVGMKIFPGFDPIYPTDPRLNPVYEVCQEHDIPLVVHTGIHPGNPEVAKYNHPKHIVKVADRYPRMKIVIAHFFWPEVEYCYQVTHAHPQIYYDTSGLADEELIEMTGLEKLQSVLLKTLANDPSRVIFGTDYAMCSRPDHIAMIHRLPISEDVRQRIFWRNAVEVFHLHQRLPD